MFEIGRVCMKIAGREAGKYCIVLKKEEPGFVLITGPKSLTKVKRRKCNIHHLEPLVEKIKIKAEASDEDILKAYKEANLLEKLGLKVKVEKKAEHKKEPKAEKNEVKKLLSAQKSKSVHEKKKEIKKKPEKNKVEKKAKPKKETKKKPKKK